MEFAGIHLDTDAWRLAVALGIGLLLGVERERRKGSGPSRAPAGIRTFALVALLGGLAMLIGSAAVLAVALAFVASVVVVAYVLGDRTDPGLTTEVAVLVAFLLGALAQEEPRLAAGTAVGVAILLASRERLQTLVAHALTDQEVHDGLLFAAAALVVLPLVPDRTVGPFDAFNPFTIWRLVVVVMAISATGYIAVRLLGAGAGLPVSGFASGFVSSSATIASMGALARKEPGLLRPAVAGAALSTVATVVQMVIVVGATDRETVIRIGAPMAAAGFFAAAYGLLFSLRARQGVSERGTARGRAFEPRTAIVFAATVGAILFASAALHHWLGPAGLVISTALAGFADAHSAGISAASLVASGSIEPSEAVVPILAGFTTNSISKAVIARVTGGGTFARDVWPGIIMVLAGAWTGWAVSAAAW